MNGVADKILNEKAHQPIWDETFCRGVTNFTMELYNFFQILLLNSKRVVFKARALLWP